MLTNLSSMAEMERELTVEQIREGMAKAKVYGTKSGRPTSGSADTGQLKKYYPCGKTGILLLLILQG